jgi:hypothetical protein
MPDAVLLLMAGAILALFCFALLIQLGVWLVRFLQLPADPPPSVLFNLPAPRPQHTLVAAREQAEQRRDHRQAYHQAEQVTRRCQEAMARSQPGQEPPPALQAILERGRPALDELEAILLQHDQPKLKNWLHVTAPELVRLCQQAEQIPQPQPSHRRLLVMLIMLIAALLWLGVILAINQGCLS